MVGPFSIDAYLPAFAGVATSLDASPLQMQQTLSAYLLGFAVMSLFHGAISDSSGRRPVVLWGLAVYVVASAGCALSQSAAQLIGWRVLQGLSTGAGIVVSRAVVRDMFPPAQAQKVMSQITIFFGVAPALAPLVGGWLFVAAGWRSVFWFLAAMGVLLWIANQRLLPESLAPAQRQPFNAPNLLRGYWQLGADPRFLALTLASAVPFNGSFLYVLSAPSFLGEILGLQPPQFFWFFVFSVAGVMSGAALSGRLAGRIRPRHQVRLGFVIMMASSLGNLAGYLTLRPDPAWALFPMAFYMFGWALVVPVVTLMLLDLRPERRGMASSLQMFFGSSTNAIVAGIVSPLVMHSATGLAWASLGLSCIGLAAWLIVRWRWPAIGQSPAH